MAHMRVGPDHVVPSSWWGAAALGAELEPRGHLRAVVLHHTALPAPAHGDAHAEAAHMRELEAGHLRRGWAAIGYHHVVMPSGRVFAGRPRDAMGAHARGHNRGTLGIALAGNFETDRPTAAALRSLDRLLATIPDVPLVGHSQLGDTACPGRHLREARIAPGEVEAITV